MWSVRYMWMGLMPVLFGYWPNVNLKFRPAPRGQLVGFHSLGATGNFSLSVLTLPAVVDYEPGCKIRRETYYPWHWSHVTACSEVRQRRVCYDR